MRDLWYKDAIIYNLDIETFMDASGDGIGDFVGLTQRLAYLTGLGVTCLWLLPFYPTPNRDNGYDVIDYYSVDPRLGTLGDFVEFMHQAGERGLRVLIDLVVNHTSDQHPWFQEARKHRDSPYRNYYVWSDTKPPDADQGMVFPGVQESTWTYDEAAGAYYFHRFYEHQPDLNIANPAVREEICKIMGFWLDFGLMRPHSSSNYAASRARRMPTRISTYENFGNTSPGGVAMPFCLPRPMWPWTKSRRTLERARKCICCLTSCSISTSFWPSPVSKLRRLSKAYTTCHRFHMRGSGPPFSVTMTN
jgi:hypothetical protein